MIQNSILLASEKTVTHFCNSAPYTEIQVSACFISGRFPDQTVLNLKKAKVGLG